MTEPGEKNHLESSHFCGYVLAPSIRVPSQHLSNSGKRILYRGISSYLWDQIDRRYHEKTLSEDISRQYQSLRRQNSDFTGLLCCPSLEVTRQFQAISDNVNKDEILALFSPLIRQIKNTSVVFTEVGSFLGYDVVLLGGWSLLAEGVISNPEAFPRTREIINAHGLLSEPSHLSIVIDEYREMSRQGSCEELLEPRLGESVDYLYRIELICLASIH